MSGYSFHPAALAELEEIWEYIAADSFDAADRVIDEIERSIRNLAIFPHAGHVRPDLTSKPLRFHPVGSYLICYLPDSVPIVILSILHARRSPRVLAAILRDRK
jgi:plasmid stabilization system protein ParE